MMSTLTILELFPFLSETRNTLVNNFMEPAVTAQRDPDTISQIIGVLTRITLMTSSYLSQARFLAINIRDLLGIRNINSANPSTVGKTIPTLNSESRTVEDG